VEFLEWLVAQGYGKESGRIAEALVSYVAASEFKQKPRFHPQQVFRSWNLAKGYLAMTDHGTDERLSEVLGVPVPPK
jgi:hypothetical protein